MKKRNQYIPEVEINALFSQYKHLSLWHNSLQENWTSDAVYAAECNLHEVYFVTVNDSSLFTSKLFEDISRLEISYIHTETLT